MMRSERHGKATHARRRGSGAHTSGRGSESASDRSRGWSDADLARAEEEMRRSRSMIESGESYRSQRKTGREKAPGERRGRMS